MRMGTLKNQKGSTLVAAVIMSSVLLAVGVAMFGFFIVESRINKINENNVTAGMINAALRTVLFDPPLCSVALGGQNSGPSPVNIAIKSVVSINGVTGTLSAGAPNFFPGFTVAAVQLIDNGVGSNDECAAPITAACSQKVYASPPHCIGGPPICNTPGPVPFVDHLFNVAVTVTLFQPGVAAVGKKFTVPVILTVAVAPPGNKILGCQSMGLYPLPPPPANAQTPYSRFDLCTGAANPGGQNILGVGGVWVGGATWTSVPAPLGTSAGSCDFPATAASTPTP